MKKLAGHLVVSYTSAPLVGDIQNKESKHIDRWLEGEQSVPYPVS